MSPSRGQGQLGKQRFAPFLSLRASHSLVWRQGKYSGVQVSLGASWTGAERAPRLAQKMLAGLGGPGRSRGILTPSVPGVRSFYPQNLALRETEISIEEVGDVGTLTLGKWPLMLTKAPSPECI